MRRQRVGGLRIVRAIQPHVRPSAHELQAARPAHGTQSLANGLLTDRQAARLGKLESGQGTGGIVHLVPTRQRA